MTIDHSSVSLEDLDRRLARLEETLSGLTDVMRTLPGIAAMAADSADEVLTQSKGAAGVLPEARVKAAAALMERLTDPERARRLENVIERLDVIEEALDMGEALPGIAGTLADSAESLLAESAVDGIELEARVKKAARLLGRASRPEVLESLERLLPALPLAGQSVALAADAPKLAATLGDGFDEVMAALLKRGIDPDERVKGMLALLEKLTEPRKQEALSIVLDRLELIAELTQQLDALPGMAATLVDTVDEWIRRLRAAEGIEPDSVLDGGRWLALRGARLVSNARIRERLDQGFLAPRGLRMLLDLGASLSAAAEEPRQAAGFRAIFSALRDPPIQNLVDFSLSVARRFGRALKNDESSTSLLEERHV